MALGTNELFSEVTQEAYPKIRPYDGGVKSRKLAASGGAELLAVGTPMAFDTVTLNWKVWATAGANEGNLIKGFVYPDEIQLDASDEVLGNLMLRGEIHRTSVVTIGGTDPQLDTALEVGPRALGLDITGLEDVR